MAGQNKKASIMSVGELKAHYQNGTVRIKRVYVETQYEEGRFIGAVLDLIGDALPVIEGVSQQDGGAVFRVAAGSHQVMFHTGCGEAGEPIAFS